jgi:lipopolysaccharide export system permease protein
MKTSYDEYLTSKSNSIYVKLYAKELYQQNDSIDTKQFTPVILDNYDLRGKLDVLNAAINNVKTTTKNIKTDTKNIQWKRKKLNLYDIEFHNRIAFSLSCLILFFIGAPLGSIIRKGGFGLPMILAISIYVIYFFANTFGRNLAEESSLSAILGSWVSTIVMVPFAFFLTRRASKGMGLFNIDVFLQPLTRLVKKSKPSE